MQVGDKLLQYCLYFVVLERVYLQQKDILMLHKRFLYIYGDGWKIRNSVLCRAFIRKSNTLIDKHASGNNPV